MSKDFSEKAVEILRASGDGDTLSPTHLKLVELAVNGFLNEAGETAFDELHRNATKPAGYTIPWFHDIEHLTRDHSGYVRWKGIAVEHYESPWCYTADARAAAEDVAQCCRLLDSIGETPTITKVAWQWNDWAEKVRLASNSQ